MIIDALVRIVFGILTGFLGLFPAYALPGSMTSLGQRLGNAVSTANGIFPVQTLGICIGVMLGAHLFILLWALVVWVYTKIPAKFT